MTDAVLTPKPRSRRPQARPSPAGRDPDRLSHPPGRGLGLLRLERALRHHRRRRNGRHRRVRPAGPGPADRPRVRVRQRLPRHRQRGRDGDLHQQPAAGGGGDLFGNAELRRRHDLDRRGGLHHRHPAAGRVDPAGRQHRRRRCDDLCSAPGGDRLEPRHLVVRHPQQLLPRADRLDHGRRPGQSVDGPERPGDQRRRLVSGDQGVPGAAVQPPGRLRRLGHPAAAHQAPRPRPDALSRSRRPISRRRGGSVASWC